MRSRLRLIVLMSCGSTRSYPSISPVWSACRRAALSGIARKIRRVRLGLRPQYSSFRLSSSRSPTRHDSSLNGPGARGLSARHAVVAERLVHAVGGEAAPVGAVLPHRRRALDRERRQGHRCEEGPVRALQVDDGDVGAPCAAAPVERVLRALRLEAAEDVVVVVGRRRRLLRALEVVPTVEVRAHGRRVERRSVVELDVAAEGERPTPAAVALDPLGREHRSELRRARLKADERLRDLVHDAERLTVRDQRRIQHDRVCRGAEDHRRRRLARLVGPARCDSRDQKREHRNRDSCSENFSHSFPSFLLPVGANGRSLLPPSSPQT